MPACMQATSGRLAAAADPAKVVAASRAAASERVMVRFMVKASRIRGMG